MSWAATPLIGHGPETVFAWRQGEAIPAEHFLRDVNRLAAALPQGRYLINLCEDRYRFMVAFAAALQRGQVCLMPSNNTAGAIDELCARHAGSYSLGDRPLDGSRLPPLDYETLWRNTPSEEECLPLSVDPEQEVAILFTSGSTGQPKPNPKRWINLQREALSALSHFPFRRREVRSLVATVPAQHMYGLATSILFPWQGGFAVDAGRPFFPADIAAALAQLPAPRVLITTPLHLRACASAGIGWPEIAFVISATAPLSRELAGEAEERLDTEVYEIYGSTETGSVAGRRTARENLWHLYQGISLRIDADQAWLQGGHLTEPVLLNDRLEPGPEGSFRLLGRHSDMVKIAGKRASLGDLTHQLLSIPGVEDGLFLPPDEDSPHPRLTALAVAPSLSKTQLLEALAHSIDPVFLPRPLFRVERLPRNETGKLPQSEIRALLRRLRADARLP